MVNIIEKDLTLLETIVYFSKHTKLLEILSENQLTCQINILGETKIKEGDEYSKFILKIRKKEFSFIINESNNFQSLENLQKLFSSPRKYFENDVYQKYITQDLIQNKLDVELIYPATEKQIEKYKLINYILFHETYDIYLNKTLPYINSIQKKDIKWIYNIFEKKTEIPIGEAPSKNFLILKDYSAINNDKSLICLGIPIPQFSYIKSIRDLTEKELSLLKEFYNDGKEIIAKKYGCKINEIKAYVHYPPSFYYFHVHYTNVNDPNITSSSSINRAIDLNEIIENIKLMNNYYQNITIDHIVQVNSKLYKALFS